jgi:tetratricopeptide (TPR) repeat protein
MRSRSTLLIATVALALVPLAAHSQSDPSLKLSSTAGAIADFRAGVTDFQNVTFESAAAHFKAALAADPNFGLARVLYASTNAALTPEQQKSELDRGVTDAARATTDELLLATAYREAALGHAAAANAIFGAASQLMPADELVAFAAAGGFNAPLATTRDFVARHPNYAAGYNTLAYQSWAAGDRAGALAAAKRQVELLPSAPNPHDSYAEMLQWNGDFAGATAHYQDAAKLAKFPEAYAGLAEVAALQGQYDQARSYLNQAIANAWTPQQKVGYLRQIVGTYALQGAPSDVVLKALNAAIDQAKANGDARATAVLYSQLATAQAFAGNTAAAHQSVALAEATPNYPGNVHYFAGMAHALMKHWSPAAQELAALKAQAASSPNTVAPAFIAALEGVQLTQQGKPADALKILMASDTTNDLVMNRIAEAHAALGHADEAAAWNNRVNADYALNLADFTSANSRRRAKMETARR